MRKEPLEVIDCGEYCEVVLTCGVHMKVDHDVANWAKWSRRSFSL